MAYRWMRAHRHHRHQCQPPRAPWSAKTLLAGGANDQARTAAEYAPLVLRWNNGNAVRLSDVADVTDSVQDMRNYGVMNGKPAVLLQVFKQPGANILQAVDKVRAAAPAQGLHSPAIDVTVISDRTHAARLGQGGAELAADLDSAGHHGGVRLSAPPARHADSGRGRAPR
jgi:hypothetical protein